MKNEADVREWLRFSDMDMISAKHLNTMVHHKPLEIICYHCQQAAEKMLKALILANDGELQKTHDLGLLAEQLEEFFHVPENVLNAADSLTPYGVKIRYPQDLFIDESHVIKALLDMQIIEDFTKKQLDL